MQSYHMPQINLDALRLTTTDLEIVKRIVGTRGDTKGKLRASKPDLKDDTGRMAAYVWRMVAFSVSPIPAHHCMPCTAEFDLPRDCWEPYSDDTTCERRRALVAHLDEVTDIVVKSVPVRQWYGVERWAQVFGQTGTPQVAPDGAIIYR